MNIAKRARLANDLTLRQLARRADVSYGSVVRADAGQKVSALVAWRLATTLGVDPEEFVIELNEKTGTSPTVHTPAPEAAAS